MNDQTGYDATIQMPEGASTLAHHVDSLYYDIFWISVVFFVAIVGCMVVFAYKYRRRKGVKAKPETGNHTALEVFWTLAPLVLLGYMFHQGIEGFMMMSIPPANAINIRAEARQWSWNFRYPSGRTEGELTVPINEPVRLIMSSHPRGQQPAVLHAFFAPALRVKRDIVPGMYTSLWFEPTRLGDYNIYCAEYCGLDQLESPLTDEQIHANGRPSASVGHSGMLSRLHVVSAEDWAAFDNMGIPAEFEGDHAAWGQDTFESQCVACHVVNDSGTHTIGPNLYNVVGYDQPLEGGGSRMADLEYMRESLREPSAAIVEGFAAVSMTSFASFNEAKIDAIVEYLSTQSDRGTETIEQLHAGREE